MKLQHVLNPPRQSPSFCCGLVTCTFFEHTDLLVHSHSVQTVVHYVYPAVFGRQNKQRHQSLAERSCKAITWTNSIHWRWLMAKHFNLSEAKPVQGCQSCTCVWPICSWPADSPTCWWCCAHLPLDKWKTFPWRAVGRHADESFILICSHNHTNLILSVCFPESERQHARCWESAQSSNTEGADMSGGSLTSPGAWRTKGATEQNAAVRLFPWYLWVDQKWLDCCGNVQNFTTGSFNTVIIQSSIKQITRNKLFLFCFF